LHVSLFVQSLRHPFTIDSGSSDHLSVPLCSISFLRHLSMFMMQIELFIIVLFVQLSSWLERTD